MKPWLIVTGASGSLAETFIRLTLKSDWRILAVTRQKDFPAIFESSEITIIQADVSTMTGTGSVINFFKERDEVPEGLAHLAGSFLLAGLLQTSEEQYRACLAANLDSAFFMLKAFVSSLDIQPGSAGFLFSIFATKVLDTVIVPCGRPFGKKGRPMRSVLGFSESLPCPFSVSLPSAFQSGFPTFSRPCRPARGAASSNCFAGA
ncbi:SDR family NAD(P)-dependent oxidoreductase [Acidithiobacillus thiooxidans]|uniref:SDR family NAD(P)-dependent oxidoreductase n=1 Tax=Acidithiobacillus thiooxidans TaxID=930 RepID=UPI001300C6E8|nr:SDR family NAD(P)-dependent oxidoreductase [Acidithiobacillus thiooxidans]